jgi:hypothetical protein
MNARLIHDRAHAAAVTLVSIVAPCLRPEEHGDAYQEFYRTVKEALELYAVQSERLGQRLQPPAREQATHEQNASPFGRQEKAP